MEEYGILYVSKNKVFFRSITEAHSFLARARDLGISSQSWPRWDEGYYFTYLYYVEINDGVDLTSILLESRMSKRNAVTQLYKLAFLSISCSCTNPMKKEECIKCNQKGSYPVFPMLRDICPCSNLAPKEKLRCYMCISQFHHSSKCENCKGCNWVIIDQDKNLLENLIRAGRSISIDVAIQIAESFVHTFDYADGINILYKETEKKLGYKIGN